MFHILGGNELIHKSIRFLFCTYLSIGMILCESQPNPFEPKDENVSWFGIVDYSKMISDSLSEGSRGLPVIKSMAGEMKQVERIPPHQRHRFDKNKINVFCPNSIENCIAGTAYGSNIYVQLNNAIGFDMLGQDDYDKISNLASSKHFKIIGVWHGPPDDEKLNMITIIVHNLSGLLINWNGDLACPDKIKEPRLVVHHGVPSNWVRRVGQNVWYYVANQNKDCEFGNRMKQGYTGDFTISNFIKPVLPCFNGKEWRCLEAIGSDEKGICDYGSIRFVFDLNSITSYFTLLKFEDMCNKKIAFDIAKAI